MVPTRLVIPMAIAALALVACSADGGPPPPKRQVELELGATPVATISERYLSVAVDSAQVVGGLFWDPAGTPSMVGSVEVPVFDFDRPKLRKLAKELAPALLRIGGSTADEVFYDLSDTPTSTPPEHYKYVMTKAMWDGVGRFAKDLDFRLLFTLNAGKGPRDATTLAWKTDNARELVRYSVAEGFPVDVWELGNELNGYQLLLGLKLQPEQYEPDFAAAKGLLAAEAPQAKLAGPSPAYWPKAGDFIGFYDKFMPVSGKHLDLVTWHYYPMQSRRCSLATRRATIATALDPVTLDELQSWAAAVEAQAEAHAKGAEVWLGETGNSQCGGEPGVADAFVGSFWWLDQLGALAARGQQRVIRQTLAGSNYGLLDDVTLDPKPDYWASVLWRRTIGQRVLELEQSKVEGEQDTLLRSYAHCTRDRPGAVTLLALNLSRDATVRVKLSDAGQRREVYLLSAPARADGQPDLGGGELQLNGQTLALGPGDALPELAPRTDSAGPYVDLPPTTIAFVVFPDADAPACR